MGYYSGGVSRKTLLESATDDDRKCEAYYYIGERVRIERGKAPAQRWFDRCVKTGLAHFHEHRLAKWRLEQG